MDKSLSLSFDNLSYQVNDGLLRKTRSLKQVLRAVCGEFHGCELTGIVGPSGGGKSSLLNALSGYNRNGVSGEIKLNGHSVSTNVIRRCSSYIMQENKMHDFLTVNETMLFAASFKGQRDREKLKTVERILNSLGMINHVDTRVGHLSGGQQKRLSIAIELVDDPDILFLDEPTTGLDSSSSTQCIQLLKKLAQDGKTIICTIHTPSAFVLEIFDHLYALADGCCIYQGASKNLVPFLADLDLKCPEVYSPCDFLLEIATNDYGPQNHRLTELISNGSNHAYRQISECRNLIKKPADISSPSRSIYLLSFHQQVFQLIHRSFLISIRDRMLITMRLSIHFALSIIFGILYRDVGQDASKFFDNYRYIISTIVFQLYASYFSLQTAIPLEFPILKRERFNRWYSSSAYFTAFNIVDLPTTFLCSFCYVAITYTLTNQPHEMIRFLSFFSVSLALNYASQGVGIMGSALFDIKTAVIFGSIFLAPFFTFSSSTLLMKDTHKCFHWLFQVNFLDNAIKGSLQSIFGNNRAKIQCDAVYCHYSYPSKILAEVEANVSVERSLLVLILYAMFSRIVTFMLIKHRLKT